MPARRCGYRGTWGGGRPAHAGCATEADYGCATGSICRAHFRGYTCTRLEGHAGDHVGHYDRGNVCARWAPGESHRE